MTVGGDATAAGYPLVPNTGEDGKVRFGAREINRTRDIAAQLKSQISSVDSQVPKSKILARDKAGIRSGTAAPTGGTDGDIYFQIF